jgi:hypothetical protein
MMIRSSISSSEMMTFLAVSVCAQIRKGDKNENRIIIIPFIITGFF